MWHCGKCGIKVENGDQVLYNEVFCDKCFEEISNEIEEAKKGFMLIRNIRNQREGEYLLVNKKGVAFGLSTLDAIKVGAEMRLNILVNPGLINKYLDAVDENDDLIRKQILGEKS